MTSSGSSSCSPPSRSPQCLGRLARGRGGSRAGALVVARAGGGSCGGDQAQLPAGRGGAGGRPGRDRAARSDGGAPSPRPAAGARRRRLLVSAQPGPGRQPAALGAPPGADLPAGARQALGGREGHSVLGYLTDGSVWSHWFLPGLHQGLWIALAAARRAGAGRPLLCPRARAPRPLLRVLRGGRPGRRR